MLEVNSSSLLLLSFCSAVLPLLYFFICQYYRSPKGTPCPESYPLLGNLIGFIQNRHRFHDWVADMLSATPSLTLQVNGFLGLSHGICTANPSNIEYLLRTNFQNYVKGTRFQSVLDELLGNGIFNVDGKLWHTQRKIASHEFNTRSLKSFISTTVQSHLSNRLMPYLCSVCDKEEVIDLQDILRRFTFDNICKVAFGVDPAWLNSDNTAHNSAHLSFVLAFDYVVEISSNRLMSPLPLIWKIKRRLNIGSEKHFKEAIDVINEYAMNIITTKEQSQENLEQEQEDYQDLLSRFMNSAPDLGLHAQEERRKFLRDIVSSFILAGKDSTSSALTWFFWLVAGHPRCEQLIYSELLAALAASPENSARSLNYDELKKLHYLHAALSESLRLFPPVPINSRLVTEDDALTDGTRVRKGWFADYSAYAAGRMEKLWGSDCKEFKPERWLDDNGIFQQFDQFKFPVFHSGPRMCLGKDMAYVQMKSVAAAVLSEFEVLATDGGGTPERILNPPYTLSLLLKMKGGFAIRLRRRQLLTDSKFKGR